MEKKKEIWTLKANRDYRKEKAKKLAIELEYYKKKAKYTELALKIWSEWKSELLDNWYQPQNPEPYWKWVWEMMKD